MYYLAPILYVACVLLIIAALARTTRRRALKANERFARRHR